MFGGQNKTDLEDFGGYPNKYGGYNQIDVHDFGG